MRLIGIFACFIFSWTNAQNLIPNPSLEDPNYCEVGIPCSPAGWYSVANMPYGYEVGVKYFLHGVHAISFLVAFKEEEERSYWQTALLSNIEKGKKYRLRFYLYSPVKKFNPEYFGVHFGNELFHSRKDTILNPLHWLKITDSTIRSQKKQWQEISVDFVAEADAKFMLLGNLSSTSNKEIMAAYAKNLRLIEYYIDDISLTPSEPVNKTEVGMAAKCLDSLYHSNIRHKYPAESVQVAVKSARNPTPTKIDTLVLGRINFDFDSYELQHKEMIKKYFEGMDQHTIEKIIVTGYTDSVGRNDYNVRLSENRAIFVKKYLSDSLGIPKNIILTEGRGKTNDQKLQENNRRVELLIYRKGND